jgi:hypothetical protein
VVVVVAAVVAVVIKDLVGIDSRLLAERLGHDVHATTPRSSPLREWYLVEVVVVGAISFITLHFRAHSSAAVLFRFSFASKGKHGKMTPALFLFFFFFIFPTFRVHDLLFRFPSKWCTIH